MNSPRTPDANDGVIIYSGPLAKGADGAHRHVIVIFNTGDSLINYTSPVARLQVSDSDDRSTEIRMSDIWTGQGIGHFTGDQNLTIMLQPHASAFLLASKYRRY